MKRLPANERDSRRVEQVTGYSKKNAAAEVADNFADLKFKAAFEKNENQRQ